MNQAATTTNLSPARFAKPEVQAVGAYHLRPVVTPIRLHMNENAAGFPDDIKAEVFRRLAERDWARYPDFYLRNITQRLANHAGVPYEWVMVGNGSNEILQMTLLTVVGRGDHVIVPTPTFTLYKLQASVMGSTVHAPLLQAETNFALPVDEIVGLAREHQAKAVVICTPNNPTGTAYAEAQIRQVIENVDSLVLLDEAYREFNHQDFTNLVREYDNVIVFRTFSKALAMAGVRVGYCVGRPEMIQELVKVRLPYVLNVLSETVTLTALDHPDFFRESVQLARQERDRLIRELAQLPGIHPYPSAANFILCRLDMGSASVFQHLVADGILIRDVSSYPGLKDHLRISIGLPAENDALLASLRRFV